LSSDADSWRLVVIGADTGLAKFVRGNANICRKEPNFDIEPIATQRFARHFASEQL